MPSHPLAVQTMSSFFETPLENPDAIFPQMVQPKFLVDAGVLDGLCD